MSTRRLQSPVEGTPQGGNGDYGYRTHPVSGKAGDFHGGLDIACPVGTPVLAPEPGRVVYAGWAGTGLAKYRSGLCVILRGDWTGVDWYLGHHSRLDVRTGQRVSAGQQLALSGATGNVSGPHVHIEVRAADTTATRDPEPFMRAHGITPGAAPTRGISQGTTTDEDEDEDTMPKLTDQLTLTGVASKTLDRKKISYGGAIGYAAAAGWQVINTLPQLVKDIAALRREVAALRKEIGR